MGGEEEEIGNGPQLFSLLFSGFFSSSMLATLAMSGGGGDRRTDRSNFHYSSVASLVASC